MRSRERKSWNGFLNHQERIFKQRTRKEVYQLDKLQELLRCEFFTISISKVNTCDLWFEFNLGLFLQTTRDMESLSWWPLAFYERICGRSWHGIYLVSTWFIELSRLKKVALSYRGWCTLSPLRMYVLMLKLNVFMPKWVRKILCIHSHRNCRWLYVNNSSSTCLGGLSINFIGWRREFNEFYNRKINLVYKLQFSQKTSAKYNRILEVRGSQWGDAFHG